MNHDCIGSLGSIPNEPKTKLLPFERFRSYWLNISCRKYQVSMIKLVARTVHTDNADNTNNDNNTENDDDTRQTIHDLHRLFGIHAKWAKEYHGCIETLGIFRWREVKMKEGLYVNNRQDTLKKGRTVCVKVHTEAYIGYLTTSRNLANWLATQP